MNLESLKQSILTECEEDHVGLWSVIRDVEDHLPGSDENTIRQVTLEILRDLLAQHLIEAGFPSPNGRDFQPTNLPAQETIRQIETAWRPGRRPQLGEVVWFTRGTA